MSTLQQILQRGVPERRSIGRTRINRNALLFFVGQAGVFSCCVRDVTNLGAGIQLDGLNIMPMDFDLSSAGALLAYLKTTRNDLEAPAETVAPVIREVLGELSRMPGIGFARMSGSGATCFGLFVDQAAAEIAAIALAHSHPDWWIKPAALG